MEEELESIVYSENVIGFASLANEYCNIIDSTSLLSQHAFIDKAHRILPLIYLKAIVLPDVEPIMPEMIEKSVTHEEWDAVYETIAPKMGEYDSYTEIYDALNNDEQMNSISEGFADIYQDLKDFLASYNMGTPEIMNDAIWECKNNFQQYWGQRITNILRVLHFLLYINGNLSHDDALSNDDFDPEKRLLHGFKRTGYNYDEEYD